MEQVWGIRLRCLTNCTCCETSELELFHMQIDSPTDLCEHQKRLHINNIIRRTSRRSDRQAEAHWREEEQEAQTVVWHAGEAIEVCQKPTVSQIVSRHLLSSQWRLPWRPLLIETVSVSFQSSLSIRGKVPVWVFTCVFIFGTSVRVVDHRFWIKDEIVDFITLSHLQKTAAPAWRYSINNWKALRVRIPPSRLSC